MLLNINFLVNSMVLAGAGRVTPPLERIDGLIDLGAHINDFSEASQLISRFHNACKIAKLQQLAGRTGILEDWGKQVLKGNGDTIQWLTNVNIFFQDLQIGDDDEALKQLAATPRAMAILFP